MPPVLAFPGLTGKRLAIIATLGAKANELPSISVSRAIEIWNAAHESAEPVRFQKWESETLPKFLLFVEIAERNLLVTRNGKDKITTFNGVKKVVSNYIHYIKKILPSGIKAYSISPKDEKIWKSSLEIACRFIEKHKGIPRSILPNLNQFQKQGGGNPYFSREELWSVLDIRSQNLPTPSSFFPNPKPVNLQSKERTPKTRFKKS